MVKTTTYFCFNKIVLKPKTNRAHKQYVATG